MFLQIKIKRILFEVINKLLLHKIGEFLRFINKNQRNKLITIKIINLVKLKILQSKHKTDKIDKIYKRMIIIKNYFQ
jgi:hypothetical protein